MLKFFFILFVLALSSISHAATFVGAQGEASVTGQINISFTVVSSVKTQTDLIQLDEEVSGLYKLVVAYKENNTDSLIRYRHEYLVADPLDVLYRTDIEVIMGSYEYAQINLPNDFVVVGIWPTNMNEQEVVAIFKKDFHEGTRFAMNLVSATTRLN